MDLDRLAAMVLSISIYTGGIPVYDWSRVIGMEGGAPARTRR